MLQKGDEWPAPEILEVELNDFCVQKWAKNTEQISETPI